MTKAEFLELLKKEAVRRGYRFEESDDRITMIRPDGSVAITARREKGCTTTSNENN